MKDGDNAAERKRDAAAFAVMAATDSMMLFNRREQVRRRMGILTTGIRTSSHSRRECRR